MSTDNSAITYVYDCGALNRTVSQQSLTREINEFVSRTDSIDFMFISHFDFDHVSGIPDLAMHATIKRFIIPMVAEPERLFILAGNAYEGNADGPPDDFYSNFIVDPVATLASLNSNNDAPATVQVVAPAQQSPVADRTLAPELLAPTDLADADRTAILTTTFTSTARIEAHANSHIIWEWFPYVAELARGVVPKFVEVLVREKLISSERDLSDPATLSDIVLKHRDILIAAYDEVIQEIGTSFNRNLTSLMLYSGPVPGSRHRAYRTRPHPIERAEHGAWDPRPGWLGLGDADLRAKARVAEVNLTFHSYKPLVGTFAPSHHGSKYDWHKDLLTGFDPNGVYSPIFVFSASGAYRSKHDNAVLHPDGDVLLDINEAGGTAITVGLNESSRWTESLSVNIEP